MLICKKGHHPGPAAGCCAIPRSNLGVRLWNIDCFKHRTLESMKICEDVFSPFIMQPNHDTTEFHYVKHSYQIHISEFNLISFFHVHSYQRLKEQVEHCRNSHGMEVAKRELLTVASPQCAKIRGTAT